MKNKIFSTWFRELCSLVFVQSMQALIMVVMLSVVASLYFESTDNYAAQQSLGVYAVFILYVIPKVELLVKKIFGMGSGVMDDSMMGGKKSLLKTGMALRLGGNVLNNAGKAVGGVGMMLGAGIAGVRQNRISKNNTEAAKIKNNIDTKKVELNSKSSKKNTRALSSGNAGGYSLDDLTSAIKSANAPDPLEKEKEQKHAISQMALKGLQQTTSGLVETAGAIGGAAVGGVVGLGMGDDDLLNDMIIGAGVGDKAGKIATDVTMGGVVGLNELAYKNGVSRRAVQKSAKEKEDAQKELDKLVAEINAKNKRSSNTKNVNPPTNNTTVKSNSRNISNIKNTSKASTKATTTKLTAEQKKVYEKAKAAKKAGNMDEYHKNMNMAAGMLKQQKITESKSTSSKANSVKNESRRSKTYTSTTPTGKDNNSNNGINNIGDI